jgi:RNA recognition motif-containing protein
VERNGEVRLLVRGIAPGVPVTEIAALFAPFKADPERIAIPRDRRTRRRKGIAFVIVPDDGHAQRAIDALQNAVLGEKTLTVERAAPPPPRRGRRRR